ncbi:MAG: hypothetical protein KF897_17050 [Opitutaceae bacterium]|nr:hypothetical protein [Opitutaceae bacterium]
MKKLTSLAALLGSAVATLLLAVGFNNAAQKMDPVSQKSIPISTMQTGDIAAMPCTSCSTGEDDPPPPPPPGGGLTESGNGTYVA